MITRRDRQGNNHIKLSKTEIHLLEQAASLLGDIAVVLPVDPAIPVEESSRRIMELLQLLACENGGDAKAKDEGPNYPGKKAKPF